MIISTLVRTREELQQLLALQRENLKSYINIQEQQEQGFVTLQHDLSVLEAMHRLAPSVIIKDEEKLVGYALTMLQECKKLVPGLIPMFELLDHLRWEGVSLSELKYYVMGQICIAKAYRGRGLFDQLYQQHADSYGKQFDLLITQIAISNLRSLKAHERVGFKVLHTHNDEVDKWVIVGKGRNLKLKSKNLKI